MSRRPATLLDSGFDAIATIHDAPEDDRPITPERRLACAILLRAFLDLTESDAQIRASETEGRRKDFDCEAVRGEARRFCVAMYEPHLGARLFWTDAAQVSEPLYRAICRKRIDLWREGQETAEAENRTAPVIEIDRLFARLLDAEATMDPADLDAALERLAALERAA